MATKAGLPVSVASRHLIDLGEKNRYREESHDLVRQSIDPDNRRRRLVYLTGDGKALAHRIVRAIERR